MQIRSFEKFLNLPKTKNSYKKDYKKYQAKILFRLYLSRAVDMASDV